MVDIQSISDEATAYILKKYKRLFPYCSQGAARFVTLARKQGIKAKKVSGFYGYNQHWWCRLEDGTIVDPTAAQFGRHNGVQSNISGYDEVPAELIMYMPHRDFGSTYGDQVSIQEAWDTWKAIIKAGADPIEKRGEFKTETRVDKKGWEYVYQGNEVTFMWSTRPQVRSSVTWTKGDISWGFETMQRRFVGKDGTVKYQTYQRKFKTVARNGLIFELQKGKFVLAGFYNKEEEK